MGRMTTQTHPRARAIDSSGFEVFLIARDSPLAARDRGGSRRGGIPTPQGASGAPCKVRRVLARAGCQFSDRRRRLKSLALPGEWAMLPARHVSASRNRARDPVETQNVSRRDVRLRYTHPRRLAALTVRETGGSELAPGPPTGLRTRREAAQAAVRVVYAVGSGSPAIGLNGRISRRWNLFQCATDRTHCRRSRGPRARFPAPARGADARARATVPVAVVTVNHQGCFRAPLHPNR